MSKILNMIFVDKKTESTQFFLQVYTIISEFCGSSDKIFWKTKVQILQKLLL